jgi:phosphoglucomutase
MKIKKAIYYPEHNPRASGMRLPVKTAMQPAFIETYIQALFNVYKNQNNPIKSITVGTDGRYFSKNALEKVVRVALANDVEKIFTTTTDLLSTPACSLLTKKNSDVGVLLTASHNPGGLNGDFGIKYENKDGALFGEEICQELLKHIKKIKTYKTLNDTPNKILNNPKVIYMDAVSSYADKMEELFDFDILNKFFKKKRIVLDCLHGASGNYVKEIFENRLELENLEIRKSESLPDFAGDHPEPNPLYAKKFHDEILLDKNAIGCAFDADVDRYMIVSEGRFMAPPDLLALATKYLHLAKGYKKGLKGVARSMPTARIIDAVAKDLNIPCYEVPTAWRYFTSLLDAEKITVCGEESFGTGGNHIREKDGIWGLLVWMNTLACTEKTTENILQDLWGKYGKFYTCRYDFETTTKRAEAVFKGLKDLRKERFNNYQISDVYEFNFTDEITKEFVPHQGWVIQFSDGSRVLTRLSNTGTKGALLRFYMELRETKNFDADSFEITKPLGIAGLEALEIEKHLETIKPDVIVKG